MLGYTPPGSRPLRDQTPPGPDPPGSRSPPGSRLQHTVNDRPVRILLECILVIENIRVPQLIDSLNHCHFVIYTLCSYSKITILSTLSMTGRALLCLYYYVLTKMLVVTELVTSRSRCTITSSRSFIIETSKPNPDFFPNYTLYDFILLSTKRWETRMQSSRMRTIRCSGRLLGGGVCPGGCLPREGCLPSPWGVHPLPVDRQTPVKT